MIGAESLPKKLSWFLLTSFFVFDNVVSYLAVTRWGGREANLAIAWLVEKYPLLYFVCIPAQVVIIYYIVKFLTRFFAEKIILTALVIYWPIANSFMNLAFILGHRQPQKVWLILSAVGILLAVIYALLAKKSFPVTRSPQH